MKRIIFLSIIVFLLIVIVNLSLSLYTLWSKKDLLTQTREQLVKEQQEHAQLQEQLTQVSNPSFVEEQARDKLFLGKPGESIVQFPKASSSGVQKQENAGEKPIWQQWLELFF